MKTFNKDECTDKLLAYYGDEAAQKRVRARLSVDNLKMCLITLIITLVLTFIITLIIGELNAFRTIFLYLSLLTCIPAIGALVIEYIFLVLEGSGYGISILSEVLLLVIANIIDSMTMSTLIALLLTILICQWYSKEQFAKVVDKVRFELLRNDVNVEIINNQVIFK